MLLSTIEISITEEAATSGQLKDILKVAIQVSRHADFNWDAQRWRALADSLSQSDRFKESKNLHKMCLQIPVPKSSSKETKAGTKRSAASDPPSSIISGKKRKVKAT
jgi:hypothetical protein